MNLGTTVVRALYVCVCQGESSPGSWMGTLYYRVCHGCLSTWICFCMFTRIKYDCVTRLNYNRLTKIGNGCHGEEEDQENNCRFEGRVMSTVHSRE